MTSLDVVESELRTELGRLNLKQLRERALAAGVSGEAVEEARDADEPKAALIELLVTRQAETGSSADLLLAISAGGEAAVGCARAGPRARVGRSGRAVWLDAASVEEGGVGVT
jgi:hypothetical protein